MIDTIVLRIHNISDYEKIFNQYYNSTKNSNTVSEVFVDEDTGELIQRNQYTALVFHDTGRVVPRHHRSAIILPSSHYTVAYQINIKENYLEFNFSIPKYKYSTNVLQFVNYFDQSSKTQFLELNRFLNEFLRINLIQQPLKTDIEINRIDLCYNQFFNNKADALHYLSHQEKLMQNFARSSRNKYRAYDTSIMYVTNRYSFKVYHKGTEFEKHDLKKIMKLGNPTNLPLRRIHEEANRILRYEMTFRKLMISDLITHAFYTSKKFAENEYYLSHPIAQRCRNFYLLGYQKAIEQWCDRSKTLVLADLYDETKDLMLYFNEAKVKFDETIFMLLYNKFWEKVKQYQVKKIMSPAAVLDRIKEVNREEAFKKKVGLATVQKKGMQVLQKMSVAFLLQHMQLHQLREYIPKSSYYRLRKDLDKLGITDASSNIEIPEPRTDYFEYKLVFKDLHPTKS